MGNGSWFEVKLSDYIADFISKQGVSHVFLISGGAAAHMVDSVARHPKLSYVCPEHEQNGAAAVDGYCRINRNLGVMITTSGPGATNLVTSVCNAYFDSIPLLFLCGQVATFRLRTSNHMRQRGFQETDIVSIFESITKYSARVMKAKDIRYELEKAVYYAKEGRMGPVVLDIPDDLQREEVDPKKLRSFTPPAKKVVSLQSNKLQKIVDLIARAQRPVLILGAGIFLSQTEKQALSFARKFNIPILLTWGAMDLLPYDDPLNMGGLGVVGPRGGNFAAQTSDLVIAMGTRLSQMITGGKQDLFAPDAKKVMIDIDKEELEKFTKKDFELDVKVLADLRDFFPVFETFYPKKVSDRFVHWRAQIQTWRKKYPICPPEYYTLKKDVDAHVFAKELSKVGREGDIVLTDAGGNLSWIMQAFEVKKGQRLLSAWNHSPMGFSMPSAIGMHFAAPRKEILCVIGDGGLMMCLQELAVIRKHKIPIKLFVFNNRGQGIQKQTLDTWLKSNYVAVDEKSGLAFVDYVALGKAFELPTEVIANHADLKKLSKIVKMKGPVLVDVRILPDQKIRPMLRFGAGIEDLDPKLPKKEIEAIMNIAAR